MAGRSEPTGSWQRPTIWVILSFMGVSIWTFLRSTPGELFPIAQRAVDEFVANTGRLATCEDGFVR